MGIALMRSNRIILNFFVYRKYGVFKGTKIEWRTLWSLDTGEGEATDDLSSLVQFKILVPEIEGFSVLQPGLTGAGVDPRLSLIQKSR